MTDLDAGRAILALAEVLQSRRLVPRGVRLEHAIATALEAVAIANPASELAAATAHVDALAVRDFGAATINTRARLIVRLIDAGSRGEFRP